jgi:hypothetical protein
MRSGILPVAEMSNPLQRSGLMRRLLLIGALIGVAAVAALLLQCSKNKGTNPGPSAVQINGVVSFPSGAPINVQDLSIGFGESDKSVDSSGAFSIKGTEHVPGAALAMDAGGNLLMMAVLPDPQSSQTLSLNARSTAEALVFMNPFVVENKRAKAVNAMADIQTLPQVDTLESLLTQKLAVDPLYLQGNDARLAEAIARAVVAYIDLHAQVAASPKLSETNSPRTAASSNSPANSILISPTTQTSGHLITYVGDNVFNVTNAYGRWALLRVEKTGQQVWLSPNGSMLDFFYDGLPWAPSNATFNLTIDQPDDTQQVNIYGYGLKDVPDNRWDLLTTDEKNLADKAGLYTVYIELIGGTIDVLSATNSALSGVDGWEKETELFENEVWPLDFVLNDGSDMIQIHTLLQAGQYKDLSWFLLKTVLEKILTDEKYRSKVENIMRAKLTADQLKRIESWVASEKLWAIGAGISIGNKVTNVMKTAYAFGDARYKTTFKIWKSNEDFGGITGHVMQKEAPYGPIAGANVHLSGDDANPIPGHVVNVTTDADGGFMFQNVMAGAKSLTATKAGYNDKSVDVTVTKNQVANVTIELSKKSGRISGIVVNEIFSKARQLAQDLPQYANQDTLFSGTLWIYARGNVAGQPYEDSRNPSDGRYTFDLPAGTWWIVATHHENDYSPDSIQVNVVENQATNAPRALRMKPKGSISTTVTAIGSTSFNLNFQNSGATPAFVLPGLPSIMVIEAYTMGHDTDAFDFFLDLSTVTTDSMYDAGTEYEYNHRTNPKSGGYSDYGTTRIRCVKNQVSSPIVFKVKGDPDEIPCDCGISSLGSIYFSSFGKELGDVLAGSANVTLAGYKTCECVGHDDNHDGKYDRFDVVCQNVDLDVTFRVVVGSALTMTLPQGQPFLPLSTAMPFRGVSRILDR